eukprot:CAMPEP_0201867938 /NCGR_PEP_ID=MMETSP0902-20130614/2020_1 /ASSEMBLY_ACC=CAM_ASM_000551 /TAXON_ID=420261 /ORGANISM="Thalassiosira antarctica, Strain CCMP982" /LENGTH=243 /DNA_ID=CAMNT_0048393207 /DNA_START=108 /DNA_END=839 /DNA_ORIENTATION=+
MSGIQIIHKLREESFNKETERRLQSHPYLKAAEDGTLTLPQRQAFVREQYSIQLSDATSFAFLAGHRDFAPSSLTGITVPEQPTASSGSPQEVDDLFQFLLGGEVYASSLLLAYAKAVGLDEKALRSSDRCCKAQAYPSYWARLALSGQRAAAAAACAVNFPAWGAMCGSLLESLGGGNYNYAGVDDEGLAFIKFFATPIEELDRMAASIIDKEGVSYEDLVEPVRLLQEYEIMFWDAIFEKK